MNYVHYELTQADLRRILGRNADFRSDPLCRNGSAHVALTRDKKKVTCPECREKLPTNGEVLSSDYFKNIGSSACEHYPTPIE